MKRRKSFDCVQMKNAIQAALRQETEGLTDEQIERRRCDWLENSDHPAAKWWRSARTARQKT